jgi:hypothetical protein
MIPPCVIAAVEPRRAERDSSPPCDRGGRREHAHIRAHSVAAVHQGRSQGGAPRSSAIPARVLAGTDCCFDTSAGWGRVAENVVWAKLSSLRDGARLASDRLF